MDAEALIGKEQAKRRVAVTQESLDEKMDNIRGAVTMGKPWQHNTKSIRRGGKREHSRKYVKMCSETGTIQHYDPECSTVRPFA